MADKTEHEAEILRCWMAGEGIRPMAARLGMSKRTIHAVLDRNRIGRDTALLKEKLVRSDTAAKRFVRHVLHYTNKQPPSEAKALLMNQMAVYEARLKEAE